jgi:Bacterial regulatory proteins, luxR family
MSLVAAGERDADIAEQLFISVRTVRSHLDRIRDKTGRRRRRVAVVPARYTRPLYSEIMNSATGAGALSSEPASNGGCGSYSMPS